MNSKTLGIFICTRERVDGLQRLLNNISSHAKDTSNLEVWVGYDWDDKDTGSFLEQYDGDLNIKTYVNLEKSAECAYCGDMYVNRHKDVINPMVKQSSCDYIWIVNDDVEIKTKDFDWVISNTIELSLASCSDRIFYGLCDQKFSREQPPHLDRVDFPAEVNLKTKYCCYPLITREVVDILGWALPEDYPDDGSDVVFGAVIGAINVPRKFHVPVLIYDEVEGYSYKSKRVSPGSYGLNSIPKTISEMQEYRHKLKQNNDKCHHFIKGMKAFSSFVLHEAEKLAMHARHMLSTKDPTSQYSGNSLPVLGLDIRSTYQCNNCGTFIHTRSASHEPTINCSHCGASYLIQRLSEKPTIEIESFCHQIHGYFGSLQHDTLEEQKQRTLQIFNNNN